MKENNERIFRKPKKHEGDVPPRCECGTTLIPVIYGLPGPKLFRDAEKGKIHLGGCVITSLEPLGWCSNCEKQILWNEGIWD